MRGDCEHDGDGWWDLGYGEEDEGNAEGNVYRESEEHGVKILENISFVRLRSPILRKGSRKGRKNNAIMLIRS